MQEEFTAKLVPIGVIAVGERLRPLGNFDKR